MEGALAWAAHTCPVRQPGRFGTERRHGGKGTGRRSSIKADTGMRSAGMPFHLGHHAPLPVPASGPVAEAGVVTLYTVEGTLSMSGSASPVLLFGRYPC